MYGCNHDDLNVSIAVSCPPIENLTNAIAPGANDVDQRSDQRFPYNTTLEFFCSNCNEGLCGRPSITCGDDGEWTDSPPMCS